jgi:two-component system, OmpR family, sensor histidine kinase BaeS
VHIQYKLFLAFALSSALLIVAMFTLMQWSIDRGMIDYVHTQEIEQIQPALTTLANLYKQSGNWEQLKNNRSMWHQLMSQSIAKKPPHHLPGVRPHMPPQRGMPPPRQTEQYHPALMDKQRNIVAGRVKINADNSELAIVVNNETVGWLVVPRRDKITDGFELQFLQQQREAFLIISLIVIVISALITFPLSKHLVKPINFLVEAAKQLAQGNYTIKLINNRHDELGQLAKDFNDLAKTLDKNSSARKRWIADISHELRTPLAILRGELEAMLDGVRPSSQENIQSLHQEALHLNKLIDDLYQLSNADIGGLRYRKTQVRIDELIRHQIESHSGSIENAQLQVQTQIPDTPIIIWADSTRLNQLFDNLLVNSQKYTAPGGTIFVTLKPITLKQQNNCVVITVEDSAPGVPADALPQLFDHLFRVDSSRNRSSGGSGLGLAICKQIVEAHDGTISADQSALGGVAVRIKLPISER